MRKCKYNAGDKIDPYNILMLDRTYKDKNNHWHGNFECPRCGKTFDSTINAIASGFTQSCGCLHSDCCRQLGKQRAHNLVGQKFNHLTAIYALPHKNGETIFYMCKCDCGNDTLVKVSTDNLIRGTVKSCGHLLAEKVRNSKCESRVGKRFGKLLVLELLPYDKENPGAYYRCQCDCGNICIVSGESLSAGTSSCGCLISKGEEKIRKLLNCLNIQFETQKKFPTCINPKTGYKMPFDFYIPSLRVLIEYDGEQHFKTGGKNGIFTHERVEEIQKRDNIKNDWCKNNNFILKRIPYTDYGILDKEYISTLLLGDFG